MKKFMIFAVGLSLLALFLLINCDTRNPSGGGDGESTIAEIEVQVPMSFNAPAGVQTVNITAIAKDNNGVGVPNVPLEFSLGSVHYGTISPLDSITDQYGMIEAQYTVNLQQSISENIIVSDPNSSVQGTGTITIWLLSQVIKSISLEAAQPALFLGNNASVSTTLTATVLDTLNNGISDLLVNFTSQIGSITSTFNNLTDTAGQVTATITFNNASIPSSANAVSTTVYASVGGKTDSATVTVIRQVSVPANISIIPNPGFMYLAAGTQGVSTVNIAVTDSNGNGVPGASVSISVTPTLGVIVTPPSSTNASGETTAQVKSYARVAGDSVKVTASIIVLQPTPITISAFTYITFAQLTGSISSINVWSASPVLNVPIGGSASTTIYASVVDSTNTAIQNLQLTFFSDKGALTPPSLTDISGTASVTFFTNGDIGPAHIWASAGGISDTTTVQINQYSNTPSAVQVWTDPDYLFVPEGTQGQSTIYAAVTDANGNGVMGYSVMLSVYPSEGVVVTPAPQTDASGETFTTIKSFPNLQGDSLRIVATVDVTSMQGNFSLTDTTYLNILPLESSINSLTVWSQYPVLTVNPFTSDSSLVYARVLDEDNVGIPNLQVIFWSNIGALTEPTLTDAAGVASTMFNSNGDYGLAVIWASVGEEMTDSTIIQINQPTSGQDSLVITTDKTVIYADGNVTYAIISAKLTTGGGEPISGDTVTFAALPVWNTKIASPRLTDSTGTATTTFDDNGPDSYTYPDSAMVIAKYNPLGLADTLYIMIMPAPVIDHITLTSPKSTGMLGTGFDTTTVTAYVYVTDGSYAPNGTAVHFDVTLGNVIPTDTVVTQSGQATVKYVSAAATDTAFITATCQGVVSDPLGIPLIAGDPTFIELVSITPTTLQVGGSSGSIVVVVSDTVGNGCPSKQVSFTSTLGTITALSITNSDGYATAFLSPQTQAGIAIITAITPGVPDTLTFPVQITSGYPSSIQLTSNTNTIQVQGTGGVEAATLTASVFDANGNPAPDSILVRFELLAPIPQGAHFDNGLTIDSSLTSGGGAQVSLNSGTQSGPVKVQAVTWNSQTGASITATKSNLVIASGPPNQIDIDFGSDIAAIGTSALQIEVSARVFDTYGNNVSAGTAVFFSIWDTTFNIWHGPFATVLGSATTLDTTGVATTLLTYTSEHTCKQTDVIAQAIAGEDIISDTSTISLPIYDGALELHVTPESYYFTATGPICVMRVEAVLKDGLDNPINNAKIFFSNNLGLYYCADSIRAAATNLGNGWYPSGGLWRFEQYTGPNPIDSINFNPNVTNFHQEDGQAILYMRALEVESTIQSPAYPGVFLDPQAPTVTGDLSVEVEGYDIASDPKNVTFLRIP